MTGLELESKFVWESARFQSFKKWPFSASSKCAGVKMAEAGWYCTSTNRQDPSARCPFCFKELSGWEVTDDPWEEHMKHSGVCMFAQLKKKEADMTTKEVLLLHKQRLLKIMELRHIENLKKLEEEKNKVLEALKGVSEDV